MFRLLIEQMAGNDILKCRDFSFWLCIGCWCAYCLVPHPRCRWWRWRWRRTHITDSSQTHPIDPKTHNVAAEQKQPKIQPNNCNSRSSFQFFISSRCSTCAYRSVRVGFLYLYFHCLVVAVAASKSPKKLCCLSVHYENEMQINDERREEEKLNLSLVALRFFGFIRPKEICKTRFYWMISQMVRRNEYCASLLYV